VEQELTSTFFWGISSDFAGDRATERGL